MRRLLLLIFTVSIFLFSAHAQNLDSINHVVDSSAIVINQVTQKFDTLQNRKNLENFLAGMEEREKSHQRQTYIRYGLAIIFLIVLVYGMQRKRRIQKGLKS